MQWRGRRRLLLIQLPQDGTITRRRYRRSAWVLAIGLPQLALDSLSVATSIGGEGQEGLEMLS
jgi:hypothetical protein